MWLPLWAKVHGNEEVLPCLGFLTEADASILSESLTNSAAPLPRIMLIEVSRLQFTV